MITKNKGVVVKINSISNYNFRANQNQDKKDSKIPHKIKLVAGSLIGLVGAKTARDLYDPNPVIKEPELKTLKEMFEKENLKMAGITAGKYLGLSLIIASLINFFLDEEKADKLIEDLLIMGA